MKIYSQSIPFDPSKFPHYALSETTDLSLLCMENDHGLRAEVLNYGCILKSLYFPDKDQKMLNLVLSLPHPCDYFYNPAYLGALIGRTAGRVGDGSFHLNGQRYLLSKNYMTTSAHGGNIGFDKKFFSYTLHQESDEVWVSFHLNSPHLDENYPGMLSLNVHYRLNNQNDLILEWEAVTDQDTLVNLTNHSYFNLHGNQQGDILSHELWMDSPEYAPIHDNGVVKGNFQPSAASPFNFQRPKNIGRDIDCPDPQLILGQGYDHFFHFKKSRCLNRPALSLYEKSSGISMSLFTDCEGAVLYSQNHPIENIGKERRKAIAIEPSQPPIGRNGEFISSSILRSGDIHHKTIRYHFDRRN